MLAQDTALRTQLPLIDPMRQVATRLALIAWVCMVGVDLLGFPAWLSGPRFSRDES